jgi:hypothetical protein
MFTKHDSVHHLVNGWQLCWFFAFTRTIRLCKWLVPCLNGRSLSFVQPSLSLKQYLNYYCWFEEYCLLGCDAMWSSRNESRNESDDCIFLLWRWQQRRLWRYIPEDSIRHSHCFKNLKSHMFLFFFPPSPPETTDHNQFSAPSPPFTLQLQCT